MCRIKVLFTVFLVLCVASVLRTAPTRGNAPSTKSAPAIKKTWQVPGWGLDKKQAYDQALKNASKQVNAYLLSLDPPFEWLPSINHVERHLLNTNEPERLAKDDKVIDEKSKETWECWAITVEITHQDFEDMRRENETVVRQEKQTERMVLAAKVGGLVLAGCLLVLAYLALEERTKGHLSRAVAFGMMTSLLVLGAVLFLYL